LTSCETGYKKSKDLWTTSKEERSTSPSSAATLIAQGSSTIANAVYITSKLCGDTAADFCVEDTMETTRSEPDPGSLCLI
jgi:hypothetical protein